MATVVFLIDELRMDPAVENYYGRNLFLIACQLGHTEIVKYLADRYPQLRNSVDKQNENVSGFGIRWLLLTYFHLIPLK